MPAAQKKKTPALAEGSAGAGILWGCIWLPGASRSGRYWVGPCPAGPELLQEVVEGLAERFFVGHAAVNEVAVADYVYCRY